MKPEDIHLSDWKRILIGTLPWSFMIEVLVRTLILYFALVVVLRILGKRLSGQLTILELGVMITLGAIVSAPMVMPDKGILVGIVLLFCALAFMRGMGWLGVVNEGFEKAAHGDVTMLVKDGTLDTHSLDSAGLSRNAVNAALRSKGFFHLGEIQRAYLEACGVYSILRAETPRPGLSLFPDDEREEVGECIPAEGCVACSSCGLVVDEKEHPEACPRCGEKRWTMAVIARKAS